MGNNNGTTPPLDKLYDWLQNWHSRQRAEEAAKRDAMIFALSVAKACVETVYSVPGRRLEFQPEDLALAQAWLTDALGQLIGGGEK